MILWSHLYLLPQFNYFAFPKSQSLLVGWYAKGLEKDKAKGIVVHSTQCNLSKVWNVQMFRKYLFSCSERILNMWGKFLSLPHEKMANMRRPQKKDAITRDFATRLFLRLVNRRGRVYLMQQYMSQRFHMKEILPYAEFESSFWANMEKQRTI